MIFKCLAVFILTVGCASAAPSVTQWDIFETSFDGPPMTDSFNPFVDAPLHCTFSLSPHGTPTVRVRGFYDGNGTYICRLMPNVPGTWTWSSASPIAALSGHSSSFTVVPNTTPGQSPVISASSRLLEHMDGSDAFSVGTTSYQWIHMNMTLINNTLATLANPAVPFGKMRMTVKPKWYLYNRVDPQEGYPYMGTPETDWDFTKPNPTFYRGLEQRVKALRDLGIVADIILFHPYDSPGHWNFKCMGGNDPATYNTTFDKLYLEYVVARLGSFRNVWWSAANEWDLLDCMWDSSNPDTPIWDELFRTLTQEDPYNHQVSIHNCVHYYNQSRPWITHLSLQGAYDLAHIKRQWTAKPMIWDEVMYEGDIGMWGGLTPGQMTDRFWWGASYGAYVGHGETYLTKPKNDDDQVLWWSKGDVLRGKSPPHIAWFKSIMAPLFPSISCTCTGWGDSLCDTSCLRTHSMGDGVNIATDDSSWALLHSSAYNDPPHRPADSMLMLPAGVWTLSAVDTLGHRILPPSRNYTSDGVNPTKVLGTDITFPGLSNNATIAPCKTSSASCCSSDPLACTYFVAFLNLVE